jgi:hypothetical protein
MQFKALTMTRELVEIVGSVPDLQHENGQRSIAHYLCEVFQLISFATFVHGLECLNDQCLL